MTSDADRARLLQIARQTLLAHLTGTPAPKLPSGNGEALERRAAVFVSLHHGRDLRGCIGHLEADRPLAEVVAECARAAGTEDPRFAPIEADDIATIHIEISILGTFERVSSLEEIAIGRHGLFVERGMRRGLLLPQVAPEWRWDAAMFVEQTCRKAGLSSDAWRHGAMLWRFEAEVFGEESPR
jgi:AmmeMemoRadiSam system protein A